ncbi:F-box/kelch-repeat protein At3g23880-like [Lycium ferocissimum]|uniref:F-box/kelch-repeat protein At3g23880-like n=1 Tax=Lycium ferocissimum TaxID=112874 RepID=UPI002815BE6A|nr:F-box/kelch-repeat protein At3g23880-like [Lycium ferocissimum]
MTTSIQSYSRKEIVTDILLIRLPVRSLLRFKCVCKSWHDLIKSPDFIKKHFSSKSSRPRLCICKFGVNYTPQPPLRAINLFLFPEKIIAGIVPSRQSIFRWEHVSDFRAIYGPVNGLFLLQKGFFLCNVRFAWWNPATKECRIIPMVSFELQRFFDERDNVVGIGYDAVSQDYKVLSLRTYMNDEKRKVHPKVFAAIYSLKNDSWKHIEPNFPYNSSLCESLGCTHLNGVYYWLCVTKDNVYIISTFDFTTEMFGEMEGPPIPYDHWGALMLRGGSLAAMSCSEMAQPMTSCYDIWATIGENNWIKVVTVNPPITSHWPLGIWEYDKYIYEMTQTYNLVYYDHTTKQVTDFGLNFSNIGSGSVWPISYEESLVPINREIPTEQDNIEYFFAKF